MSQASMDLREFKIPLGKLAPLETFITRQGAKLSYRFYSAWSEDLIVLYHGSGSDSRYMCVLASALAEKGIANVVTPDFRCHGVSLNASDEIPMNQLEIDLEELLIHIKMQKAVQCVTLAGHSMGGGFALRIAVSDLRNQFVKFVGIAPHLPDPLETSRPHYGGWITEDETGFNVNFPERFRTGQEKLHYSRAFLRAVHAPLNLVDLIQKMHPSLAAVTGRFDEVVDAEKQKAVFDQLGVPMLITEANHLTVVSKVDNYLSLFER